MKRNRRRLATGVLVGLLVVAGCDATENPTPRMNIEVVGTRPHDRQAFTQGLEVGGGILYEGTGLAGASTVRASLLATGEELARVELPAPISVRASPSPVPRYGSSPGMTAWR